MSNTPDRLYKTKDGIYISGYFKHPDQCRCHPSNFSAFSGIMFDQLKCSICQGEFIYSLQDFQLDQPKNSRRSPVHVCWKCLPRLPKNQKVVQVYISNCKC
jgi:hypothetical protein